MGTVETLPGSCIALTFPPKPQGGGKVIPWFLGYLMLLCCPHSEGEGTL